MKKQNRIITSIEKIWDGIYKHRYIYGLILILVLTAFQVSGSSIGAWKSMMGYEANEGVLVGKTRPIRSDEWGALTPMSFSQVYNGFSKTSEIVRGSSTDVSLVYALPTLQFFQIFRPFQIGYFAGLIFGPEMGNSIGLSFYWCARLIILFLVALDFFMIFTKKNKLLSTLGAIMIACAPVVQWWFAVNGIAEIFIFGMGLIVATYNYLNVGEWSKDTWRKKLVYLIATFISIGGYALVLYPAWQIPMAYVFGVLWIYIVATNRKKLIKSNVLPYLASVVLALISLAIVVIGSKEVISIIMNTAYPGKRVSTGGGMNLGDLLDYMVNVFLPFSGAPAGTNQPEMATFITLFPIGIITVIINQIKKKKIDFLVIALVVIELIVIIYAVVGMPEIVAKMSLLSFTSSGRAMLAAGFVNIFLLIYGLANYKKQLNMVWATVSSIVLTVTCILTLNLKYPNYAPTKLLIPITVVFALLLFSAFMFGKKLSTAVFAVLLGAVTIFSGMAVNPIRRGVDVVYNNDLMKTAKAINEEDSGRWIVDTSIQFNADFLLMSGIPTINSVNTYPDLEKWSALDKDGEYKDIYNRYAWIEAHIEDNPKKQFELRGPDAFTVYLTSKDLAKLDVKYVMSDHEIKNDRLENRETVCGWFIYKVKEI